MVGPITSPSSKGHWYILANTDYFPLVENHGIKGFRCGEIH